MDTIAEQWQAYKTKFHQLKEHKHQIIFLFHHVLVSSSKIPLPLIAATVRLGCMLINLIDTNIHYLLKQTSNNAVWGHAMTTNYPNLNKGHTQTQTTNMQVKHSRLQPKTKLTDRERPCTKHHSPALTFLGGFSLLLGLTENIPFPLFTGEGERLLPCTEKKKTDSWVLTVDKEWSHYCNVLVLLLLLSL